MILACFFFLLHSFKTVQLFIFLFVFFTLQETETWATSLKDPWNITVTKTNLTGANTRSSEPTISFQRNQITSIIG